MFLLSNHHDSLDPASARRAAEGSPAEMPSSDCRSGRSGYSIEAIAVEQEYRRGILGTTCCWRIVVALFRAAINGHDSTSGSMPGDPL